MGLTSVVLDMRDAFRAVRKHPGFAAAVVLTAALGIGATSAVFSIVHAVLIARLPYPDPDRLEVVMSTWRGRPPMPGMSEAEFFQWRRTTDAVEASAAYRVGGVMNVTGADQPQQASMGRASADFFELFAARAARGRTIQPDEDQPTGPAVVVVSDSFWRRHMNAAPDAVGRTLLLNGSPHDVIGVLEPDFDAGPLTLSLAPPPDLWLPLRLDPATSSDAPMLVAARLGEGRTLAVAQAQSDAAASAIRRSFPALMPDAAGLSVEPLQAVLVSDVRPSLILLLAATALVLLIVCANIANLLLVRASRRRREMAIRIAAGASRSRIVRQLLTESFLLSSVGGVIGVYAATIGARALVAGFPGVLSPVLAVSAAFTVDGRALAATVLISMAAALLFGIVPALQASRVDVDAALRAYGERTASDSRGRTRSIIVTAEMALALMLLVGSGLLIRSFVALRDTNPGFTDRDLVTMQMAATGREFATVEGTTQIVRRALHQVETLPGVTAAATLTGTPLSGVTSFLNITVPGRVLGGPYFRGGYLGGWQVVSSRYFDILGIPMITGRTFADREDASTNPVVVVNQLLARQVWPDGNALGQYLLIGEGAGPDFEETIPRQVIGIVGDVRHVGLEWAPRPTVYVPVTQLTAGQMSILNGAGARLTWIARSTLPPTRLAQDVARELQLGSGGVPVAAARSMNDVAAASAAPSRFNAWLMTIFGAAAALLASIGVFGVMAAAVNERGREIAIRVALGADRHVVRTMVLFEGMRLSLAGITIGTAAALALARLLEGLLFGVDPHDWMVFIAMPALLSVVALVAIWLPVRRATAIDPLAALRHE